MLPTRSCHAALSGYGQTGRTATSPASACSSRRWAPASSHRRALRVPVRVGVSIGDTLSALHGVIGVRPHCATARSTAARPGRRRRRAVRSVFNVMESLVPEYDASARCAARAGSALPGIAPTNAYPCNDGQYVLVAVNGDSIFKRLRRRSGGPISRPIRPSRTTTAGSARRGDRCRDRRVERRRTRDECSRRATRRASRGPGLHRRRHRQRPTVPGARDDRRVADLGRPHAEGAGDRAQAQRDAGSDRACSAEPRATRRRSATWQRLARAPVLNISRRFIVQSDNRSPSTCRR